MAVAILYYCSPAGTINTQDIVLLQEPLIPKKKNALDQTSLVISLCLSPFLFRSFYFFIVHDGKNPLHSYLVLFLPFLL